MKALLVGFLVLAGCAAFEPTGRQPFDPPASYRVMWDSVSACTGVPHYNFERLHFYVVPGVWNFPTPHEQHAAGYTQGQDITIAEYYLYNPIVVKHEMIHALIGRGDHPYIPFVMPCAAMPVRRDVPELAR